MLSLKRSMRTYPCIVVDDDELDRLTTVSFVERFPFLDLKVACASALEALAVYLLERNK